MQESILSLFGIYMAGLLLNLTPCVYPMLSVTVSVFSQNGQMSIAKSFARALIYVLGMAFMYSLLGASASATGSLFGIWLQSKLVLVAIGLLIFALALSMFGVWTFQMPSWLVSKVGSANRAGFLGLFVSGILVGVFAAPCIGPPVAAILLELSKRQDPILGFWTLFILAMGLGTPYLLLGTFSQGISKLPKSGVWMIWVERLFGCILLGFSFYYFLIAFYPQGFALLLPVGLIVSGIYLGFLERSGNHMRFFRLFKAIAGGLALVVGLSFFMSSSEKVETIWTPYSESTFKEALSQGRPVVLDFYADWCLPCHEMEEMTFSHPAVAKELSRFTLLKADMTRANSPEAQKAAEKFGVVGLPTLLLYDSQGTPSKKNPIIGFVPPEQILPILELVE